MNNIINMIGTLQKRVHRKDVLLWAFLLLALTSLSFGHEEIDLEELEIEDSSWIS